jgi:hypothetical protein
MGLSAFLRLRAHLIEPNQGFAAAFVAYGFTWYIACLLIRDCFYLVAKLRYFPGQEGGI